MIGVIFEVEPAPDRTADYLEIAARLRPAAEGIAGSPLSFAITVCMTGMRPRKTVTQPTRGDRVVVNVKKRSVVSFVAVLSVAGLSCGRVLVGVSSPGGIPMSGHAWTASGSRSRRTSPVEHGRPPTRFRGRASQHVRASRRSHVESAWVSRIGWNGVLSGLL